MMFDVFIAQWGLYLGLVMIILGVVLLVIFFVLKSKKEGVSQKVVEALKEQPMTPVVEVKMKDKITEVEQPNVQAEAIVDEATEATSDVIKPK